MKKDVLNIEEKAKNMIYEIRGSQVILDYDLAVLFECKNGTKDIKELVNKNIKLFPEEIYFQLTKVEFENLKLQIKLHDSNKNEELPYAFTELGICMLASFINTDISIKICIAIMNAFVTFRNSIINYKIIYHGINNKLEKHEELFYKFDKDEKLFYKFDKDEKILFKNKIYNAYSKILKIFAKAKQEIMIIDNYVDYTILDIIKKLNVNVIIITKSNNLLTNQDIIEYNKQYSNLKVIFDNTFNDRYFILDKKRLYLLGNKINKKGCKIFSVNQFNEEIIRDAYITKAIKINS